MKKHWKFILLLFVSALVFYMNVGSYGLIESSDARYAEIARAMYLSGDYLHPNLMDVHHYHKPPLTYQITALGYYIFGINSFGARFFLQIAILIQLILIYALTLQLFNKRESALWAAMIYFSFPLVLAASRNLTTDAFLTMFALLSMYAWVRYRKEGHFKYFYLFTLSLALGFLTKGPVIFLIPLLFIFAYNRTEPPKNNFGYQHFLAWILFVTVASSWFIYLVIQNPHFLNYFWGHQTVDRFAKNVFHRTEPFYYYAALAPLVGMPWLIILPFLIKIKKSVFTKRSLYTALIIAVLLPFFFFSLSSSKRILYILPFYSLLAILTAQLLSILSEGKSKIINTIVFGYAMVILLFFSATLVFNIKFTIPSLLGIVSMVFIIPIVWIYRNENINFKFRAILISFFITSFLLASSSMIMAANQLKLKSLKPIADFIIEKGLQERNIIVYNERKPSIAFHLNKSVISVYDGKWSLARETQFEEDLNWKKYLINVQDKEGIVHLKDILTKPSVLILYKNPLAEDRQWILDAYQHKKTWGKWTVYY